jgi:hypothetical protein
MYKTSAFDLKLGLLQYFRFKRQWICVDECQRADILADTGKEIIEVEVKITKYDLINGEKKKHRKHENYKTGRGWCCPNKFLFCVPEKLVNDALSLAKEINEKYGVIGFDTELFEKRLSEGYIPSQAAYIRIAKSAKKLHESYPNSTRWEIAKRASASLITVKQKIYRVNFRDSFIS